MIYKIFLQQKALTDFGKNLRIFKTVVGNAGTARTNLQQKK